MTRIRIEDLPHADENLTPEELAQVEGAGRPSFRPTIETLEGREMYATNIIATLTPAGLLKVEGTKGNDNVAIRRTVDNKQIEVLGGNTKLSFDASQVKSLQVDMGGGNDLLDVTGLGNLSRDAVFSTKDDQGQVDFRYLDQAGRQTREWDAAGRHNNETTLGNADKVLEQSWPGGENKTFHFVSVTRAGVGNLVTAEDYGNGFVVTTTNPGVGQVKTTFDRYGGMWDGQAWVPGVGQNLLSRDGKPVNGEMKTIAGQSRWVVTTGSGETKRIEVYEGYGKNGEGAKLLSAEEYLRGNLSLRETHKSDGTVVTESYKDGALIRMATTSAAKGESVVEDYKNGVLTRRETTSRESHRIEVYNSKDFQKQTSVYDKVGGKLVSRNTLRNDGSYVEEVWGEKGVYTKNVWKKEAHGAEGSIDHISKTVIDKNNTDENFRTITIWKYHVYANVWWNGFDHGVNDVTQAWVYGLDKLGRININDFRQYIVHMADGTSNWWDNARMPGAYDNGWHQWRSGNPPALDVSDLATREGAVE